MEKATSHSQNDAYTNTPEATTFLSSLAARYPILWLHVGPELLLGPSFRMGGEE